ncbi:unnamed protein product, partial [Leptidea sinapis]
MRVLVPILLLCVASSWSAKVTSTRSKTQHEKADKREQTVGNNGIEKRTPLLPTVSSAESPGIQYADTKASLPDRSPSQFAAPTTYEVSQPVPSQLAYAEHRLSLPTQNAIHDVQAPRFQKGNSENYPGQIILQQPYEATLAPQTPTSYPQQQIQYNQIQQNYAENQIAFSQEQNAQPVSYTPAPTGTTVYQTEQNQIKVEPTQVTIQPQQNIQQSTLIAENIMNVDILVSKTSRIYLVLNWYYDNEIKY